MEMLCPLLLLLLLQSLSQPTGAYKFCGSDMLICEVPNTRHFTCESKTNLSPLYNRSTFVIDVPDTLPLRDIILQYHNKLRNNLASGTLVTLNNKTFPGACRMRELIWDLELAYTARLHARTVSFKHSLCRSVKRFRHVGENLAVIYFPKEQNVRMSSLLDWSVKGMFNEYEEVEDPENLASNISHLSANHFTLIGSDLVSRVGCAFVIGTHCRTNEDKGNCFFMTCHYDYTNVVYSYMYKTGIPASKCNIWGSSASSTYQNLCGNNGRIFPRDHGN